MPKMNKYLFMGRLIPMLSKPGFLNVLVASMLRVLAAIVVLFSLAFFFAAGQVTFKLPAQTIMGGILFQAFYIVAIYAVVHTILIRARNIELLPHGDYMVMPLAAVLFKLVGEVYAFFVALMAIGGGIYVWFTNKGVSTIMDPMPWFFPAPEDPNFTGGITLIIGGVMLATAVLIGFYMLSELTTALSRATTPRTVAAPRAIASYSKTRING